MIMVEMKIIYLIQETSDPELDPDLSTIPLEYYEFTGLFSKKEADKLSAYRTYDHESSLESEKGLLFGPIYKQSSMKLEAV